MGTLLVRGLLAVALLLTFVFPAWAQDSKGIGVVTALTGRADLKRPQVPEAPLKLRDNLLVRDVVDTQKESLARILLMAKATVTVRELSRFEIREEVRPDGTQRAIIDLVAGKIRVMVARRLMKPGDELLIRTPNAIAAVRGSEGIFEVTKLPDGRAQTEIFGISGEFEVTIPTVPPVTAMVEVVSDAPPGILLAQGSASYVVRGVGIVNNILRLVGFPPAATFRTGTLQDALREIQGFRGPSVGSGTGASEPPPPATDKIVNTGIATAQAATLATGVTPSVSHSLPPQPLVAPSPITPLTTFTSGPSAVTPADPAAGSFAQLSPGNQKIVEALFKADQALPPPPAPLLRDQIAFMKLSGMGFGDIAKKMKQEGRIVENSLGEVVSKYK